MRVDSAEINIEKIWKIIAHGMCADRQCRAKSCLVRDLAIERGRAFYLALRRSFDAVLAFVLIKVVETGSVFRCVSVQMSAQIGHLNRVSERRDL